MTITLMRTDGDEVVLILRMDKGENEKLTKLLDSGKRMNDYDKELVSMAEKIVRLLR